MKVCEKILLDRPGLEEHGPINIVIFGDSVSHGAVRGYNDYENVYWNVLKKKMNQFRGFMPVNMICASIGGTTAKQSLARMEKQVFKHEPDLLIVCFGLNDVNGELDTYLSSLRTIFARANEQGVDTVFMTPNMLNTYVAEDAPKEHWNYAHITAEVQNSGRMDRYMNAAVALAEEMGITVCDCYSAWKKLSETEDTTMLLANRINHPTREMHELFATMLFDTIIGECDTVGKSESTMYRET